MENLSPVPTVPLTSDILNPVALEKIAAPSQIDVSAALTEANLSVSHADRLGRFQDNVGQRTEQTEELQEIKSQEKSALEAGVEETKQKLEQSTNEIAMTIEERNDIELAIAQKTSLRESTELAIDQSEAKLDFDSDEIDNAEEKQKQNLRTEYAKAIVAVNKAHVDEVTAAGKLLADNLARIESGKALDETAQKAMEDLGQGAAVAEALRQAKGAEETGLPIAQSRINEVAEKIKTEKEALEKKYNADVTEVEKTAKEKKEAVEKEFKENAEALNHKLDTVNDELAALSVREDEVKARFGELMESRKKLFDKKDFFANRLEGVDSVINDLQAKIDHDKEMLERVVDKIGSVEARGAGAVRNLETVMNTIVNRMESVSVAGELALAELDQCVLSRTDQAEERSTSTIDTAAATRLEVQARLTDRIKKEFSLEEGADGRLMAVGLTGLDAMMAEHEAYDSVKDENKLAQLQLREAISAARAQENIELEEIAAERVRANNEVIRTISEARGVLDRVAATVKFLQDEAIERFGPPEATASPVTEPQQLNFATRAVAFIRNFFKG